MQARALSTTPGPVRAALLAALHAGASLSVSHAAVVAGVDERRARFTLLDLRRAGAVVKISDAAPTGYIGCKRRPGRPPALYALAQAANEPRFDACSFLRAAWR